MKYLAPWIVVACSMGCGPSEAADPATYAHVDPPEMEVVVDPRTPHLSSYPCAEQCHDARVPDPARRELTAFHAGRRVDHGPALRWCDDCHSIASPDRLRLRDGELISFDEPHRICAQCHAENYRDWEHGIHGIQTGGWRGTVHRRTCTACHDPHAPAPIWLEALPPPEADPRVDQPVSGERT